MKKKVLLIDDSALMRRVISDIIDKTEDFKVTHEVSNGFEGLAVLDSESIDIIILDMHMPRMNGVEFMRVLKENQIQIPVITISGYSQRDTKDTLEVLELGALEFLRKPDNIVADKDAFRHALLRVLKYAIAEKQEVQSDFVEVRPKTVREKKSGRGKLVVIASSTGGPKALQDVVPLLPANLNAPVLIVQHMPAGFTNSLASRLDHLSEISVHESGHNVMLQKGHVYIAKGGQHMLIESRGSEHFIVCSDAAPISGLRPCANLTFYSLDQSEYEEIVCVVLTGMGADGTKGIGHLNSSKMIYVIAQDAETSTIYGMPKAITEAGLVDEIKPLNEIADAIVKKVGVF